MAVKIETTKTKQNILKRRNIETDEDLLNVYPRLYMDFRTVYESVEIKNAGNTGCFIGTPDDLKRDFNNNRAIIKFKLYMDNTRVSVVLIGQNFMYAILKRMVEAENKIAVFGCLEYKEPYGFSIMQPLYVDYLSKAEEHQKLIPVYTKYEGISSEWMNELRTECLAFYNRKEQIELEEKYEVFLPETKEAYKYIHFPQNLENIEIAKKRIDFNKLLDFCEAMAKKSSTASPGTAVNLAQMEVCQDIIKNLPYELTEDQKTCVNEIIAKIKEGKRISYLVQGDVGTGKTMVALLLSFAMASNGYQTVIMAPTGILASQHFKEFSQFGEKYGIKVAYLDGTVKAKEKRKILEELKSGEIKILIGTHAVAGKDVEFKNIGLTVIDEEHRFGVEQREALTQYEKFGCNSISMSATPIPRSIASALYGNIDVFDIKTMPSNRQPVQTAISSSDAAIFKFLHKQLTEGRQAYIVCPMIEKGSEGSLMENIMSVEENEEKYRKEFEPKGYRVSALTGKMSDKEMEDIIQQFKENKIQILVSTSVVEVGVNVPNASLIVICNAERFGLAALHQLRGRVGRGQYKGYCVLQSEDTENERLMAMTKTTNGFEIANQDLKLRGSGDLTGTSQSGFNEIMDLIIRDPELYKKAERIANEKVKKKIFL